MRRVPRTVVKAADSNHRSSLKALASFAQISASALPVSAAKSSGFALQAGAVLLPPSARYSTILNNSERVMPTLVNPTLPTFAV